MSESKHPQEFWIREEDGSWKVFKRGVWLECVSKKTLNQFTHVIEISAIETRDKQIESLKSDLRQAAFHLGMVATEEFCVEWEHYKPIAEDWLKEAAKLKEGKQ